MLNDKLSQYFQLNESAINLRHERQKILANNVANADTPGFKAQDIDFTKALGAAMNQVDSGSVTLNKTESGHFSSRQHLDALVKESIEYRSVDQPSLDGNTVDLDVERAQFLDNSMRYQIEMTLLNNKIKGLRAAMRDQ